MDRVDHKDIGENSSQKWNGGRDDAHEFWQPKRPSWLAAMLVVPTNLTVNVAPMFGRREFRVGQRRFA